MSRTRFRIVFILLVLILLAASVLFAILTYWLDAGGAAEPAAGQGEARPIISFGLETWRLPPLLPERGRMIQVLYKVPSPARQRDLYQRAGE